jgi:hypothetical protein
VQIPITPQPRDLHLTDLSAIARPTSVSHRRMVRAEPGQWGGILAARRIGFGTLINRLDPGGAT